MAQRCDTTGKIRYPSTKTARRATAKAGNRIRTYRCHDCGDIHVTNQDRRR